MLVESIWFNINHKIQSKYNFYPLWIILHCFIWGPSKGQREHLETSLMEAYTDVTSAVHTQCQKHLHGHKTMFTMFRLFLPFYISITTQLLWGDSRLPVKWWMDDLQIVNYGTMGKSLLASQFSLFWNEGGGLTPKPSLQCYGYARGRKQCHTKKALHLIKRINLK